MTYAQQAADITVSTAQTSAGSDATKPPPLAAGNTAATDATTASTAASVFSTANSDNITMYKAVFKVSDNLGDGAISKVKCSMPTGNLTFNDEPLDAGNEKELAHQCKAILNQ